MDGIEFASSNGVTLAYQTFGSPRQSALLLVMGLGTQMLWWDVEFCQLLAERGHYVIRFDNRDIGLSTHLDELPTGQPVATFLGRPPAYRISDMADDAAGLIEHLDVGSAHVVGASMGGCISQALTLQSPDLVRSLNWISSRIG